MAAIAGLPQSMFQKSYIRRIIRLAMVLDESINTTISKLLELLPLSEFTPDLEALLRDTWKLGRSYGEAFARLDDRPYGKHGLVFLDPQDSRLKSLAAPLYAQAALRAPDRQRDCGTQSRSGGGWISRSGNSFRKCVSAFPPRRDRARHAVTRNSDGRYTAKNSGTGLHRRRTGRLSVTASREVPVRM